MSNPLRGRVYWADLGNGRKPFVVVSNNRRNQIFDNFLAVRITTTDAGKIPAVASVVELSPHDPLAGRVRCDDVVLLYRDEILGEAGALTAPTMLRVREGLKSALAI